MENGNTYGTGKEAKSRMEMDLVNINQKDIYLLKFERKVEIAEEPEEPQINEVNEYH